MEGNAAFFLYIGGYAERFANLTKGLGYEHWSFKKFGTSLHAHKNHLKILSPWYLAPR